MGEEIPDWVTHPISTKSYTSAHDFDWSTLFAEKKALRGAFSEEVVRQAMDRFREELTKSDLSGLVDLLEHTSEEELAEAIQYYRYLKQLDLDRSATFELWRTAVSKGETTDSFKNWAVDYVKQHYDDVIELQQ